MACPERERLEGRYADVTRIYSEAVQELRNRMGKVTAEELIRMDRHKERARFESETARLDLERHLTKHGCRET